MKTTLTKVLVTSLLFSVAGSSVMQAMASKMVCNRNLEKIRGRTREGMPLTFKLGADGEIASVNSHGEEDLVSVFVLTENLSENSFLFSHRFSDTYCLTDKRSLMEAIIEGHGKREDRFGQEFNNLRDWVYGKFQIEIPTALILLIGKYFPSYRIHQQNSALIKQVKTMREGRVNELREIIESGAIDDLNRQAPDSLTSLKYATYSCLPEIVALLLESKADPDIRNERNGKSLLLHALGYDNLEIAELLIKYDADSYYEDDDKSTKLFYVARDNNLKAVKLLIENEADVNHVNDRKEVALDWAKTCLDNSEMIELLQSYQAMGLSVGAIVKGNVDELREAIESNGVDPNEIINGSRPLAYATYLHLPKVVDLLLEKKADPDLCDNYNGSPPLHTAVDCNNVEIARRLLMGRADVAQKNWKGDTASSKAKVLSNPKMIDLLQSYE